MILSSFSWVATACVNPQCLPWARTDYQYLRTYLGVPRPPIPNPVGLPDGCPRVDGPEVQPPLSRIAEGSSFWKVRIRGTMRYLPRARRQPPQDWGPSTGRCFPAKVPKAPATMHRLAPRQHRAGGKTKHRLSSLTACQQDNLSPVVDRLIPVQPCARGRQQACRSSNLGSERQHDGRQVGEHR